MATTAVETDDAGTSLVERKATVMMPIAAPAELIKAHDAMRQLIKGALQQGVEPGTGDYGIFPGTDKRALYKPGAEKIALGMGCYYGPARIVEREVDHNCVNKYTYKKVLEWHTLPNGKRRPKSTEEVVGESFGLYRYVIAVDVINRATGETVGQGIGSCCSMESKYISRPRDCENTVVKMAHKRAIVGAALISFGLSGEFNSGEDPEDDNEREPGEEGTTTKPAAKKANGADVPSKCGKCGSAMYDNRADKDAGKVKPTYPDFKCKDKACGHSVWLKQAEPSQEELAELEFPND